MTRVALVGYGLAGRLLHGPLITAVPGFEVAAVVTADRARQQQARDDFPRARVLGSARDLWNGAAAVDLAVIATATGAHAAGATAAMDAGLDVVVDKPLAPTAAEARALAEHAAAAGRLLVPFHNRRWDSDHLTVARLIGEDRLGQVIRYESRFERWRPAATTGAWREELPAAQGGGVLLDLGPHLVDQALQLFGPVERVYAEVRSHRGGADDDGFIALTHAGGTVSHLWMSALAAAPGPRLRVLGGTGAYVIDGMDGQEDALRRGARPDQPDFGSEPPHRWGRLARGGDDVTVVPSEPGRWVRFYAELLRSLRGEAAPPVAAGDGIAVLEVLDAARAAAADTQEHSGSAGTGW